MAGPGSRIRRRRLALVLLLAVAAFATACGSGADEPPEIAATVDGRPIESEQVQSLTNRFLAGQLAEAAGSGLAQEPLEPEEARRFIVNFLVRFTYLEVVADEFGVEAEVSDQALAVALEAASAEDFASARTAPEDIEMAVYAGELSRQLGLIIFPEVPVADSEVQQLYDGLAQRFQAGWEASVEVAFLAVEEDAATLVDDALAGMDFVTRAEELGAIQAGSMGRVANYTALPDQYLDEIDGLESGEISAPLEASGGYLVFRVVDRVETEEQSVDDVRGELETEIADTKRQSLFDEWLTERLLDADVEVDSYYGEWDSERGRVV